MPNQDDEIRGRALATSTLLHGLITALTKKGILNDDEKNRLYEIVLQNFEKADPNDPAIQVRGKSSTVGRRLPRPANLIHREVETPDAG
jgi:hypothetical protein